MLRIRFKKLVVIALSAVLFVGAPVITYTTVDATGNSELSVDDSRVTHPTSTNLVDLIANLEALGWAPFFETLRADQTPASSSGTASVSTPAPAPASQNNKVAGVAESSIKGDYTAKSVEGVAVMTTQDAILAQITQSSDPAENNIKVFTWDITEKVSPAAYASLNSAAQAAGAECVGMFQMNFARKQKAGFGKYTDVPAQAAAVTSTIGIPSKARVAGARYAAIRVVEGGAYTIHEDLDTDQNTVTIEAPAGYAAYALIRYN